MQIGMVSALCVFLPLIYSPSPAAAQFNPRLPPAPQAVARRLPSSGKLLELQAGAGLGDAKSNADLLGKLKSLLQRRRDDQQQDVNPTGIQSQVEASKCTHIVIIEAPNVDPKMIREIPKEFASRMPTWQGLPPCSGDLLGSVVIPQGSPFVSPGPIGAPTPNPGMRPFGRRP